MSFYATPEMEMLDMAFLWNFELINHFIPSSPVLTSHERQGAVGKKCKDT